MRSMFGPQINALLMTTCAPLYFIEHFSIVSNLQPQTKVPSSVLDPSNNSSVIDIALES